MKHDQQKEIKSEILDSILKDMNGNHDNYEKEFVHALNENWIESQTTRYMINYLKSLKLYLMFQANIIYSDVDSVFLKNIFFIRGKIETIDDLLRILQTNKK